MVSGLFEIVDSRIDANSQSKDFILRDPTGKFLENGEFRSVNAFDAFKTYLESRVPGNWSRSGETDEEIVIELREPEYLFVSFVFLPGDVEINGIIEVSIDTHGLSIPSIDELLELTSAFFIRELSQIPSVSSPVPMLIETRTVHEEDNELTVEISINDDKHKIIYNNEFKNVNIFEQLKQELNAVINENWYLRANEDLVELSTDIRDTGLGIGMNFTPVDTSITGYLDLSGNLEKLAELRDRILPVIVGFFTRQLTEQSLVDQPIPSTTKLVDKNDVNLNFYSSLKFNLRTDDIVSENVPINNTVFDQELMSDVPLIEFLLPGNKLVFMYGDKQIGISYRQFVNNVMNGSGIFYECSRVFPNEENHGTFNFTDIYAQPYIEIALTARYYIKLEDFKKLLDVPVHPYWKIQDTDKTLVATASRSSVLSGGPVQNQLHCQKDSDLKVYTISPYVPVVSQQQASIPEVSHIVNLKQGEETTQFDISIGNTVFIAKQWYAREKSLNAATLRFIFSGRILQDTDLLTAGTTVLVMGGTGGRRTRRKKAKGKRKATQKK